MRYVLFALLMSILVCSNAVAKPPSNPSSSSIVKQPKNWGAQYINNSCIVLTDAAAGEGHPRYDIRMGYIDGNQLIFIFSFSQGNEYADATDFPPPGTKVWLAVDGAQFEAMGISNVSGELITTAENSIRLQKALANATSIGVNIQFPDSPQPQSLQEFTLANIPGAVAWLDACNLVGAGALPK